MRKPRVFLSDTPKLPSKYEPDKRDPAKKGMSVQVHQEHISRDDANDLLSEGFYLICRGDERVLLRELKLSAPRSEETPEPGDIIVVGHKLPRGAGIDWDKVTFTVTRAGGSPKPELPPKAVSGAVPTKAARPPAPPKAES